MQYGGTITACRSTRKYRFGETSHSLIGSLIIRIPVPSTHVTPVSAEVINLYVPLLIVLDILFDRSAILDIGNHKITPTKRGWETPLVWKLDHMYVEWPPTVLFTTAEMRKIHRHFFHSHPEKFFQLLRRADTEAVSGENVQSLKRVRQECNVCQRLTDAPIRVRGTLPGTDCVLQVHLPGTNDYRVTDFTSHCWHDRKYPAACFLNGESKKDVWDDLFQIWANVYVGYPESIAVDQRPQCTCDEWTSLLATHYFSLQKSGVESHNVLRVGERYHFYLRQIN